MRRRFFDLTIGLLLLLAPVIVWVEPGNAGNLLSATVTGRTVAFDWSMMPAAPSYTMAVARADATGRIDMSTLSFIDMGRRKTFATSGLPSGRIFYAAILANAPSGIIPSNTVSFMPFAGTVEQPGGVGGVLALINDPGGLGRISLYGTLAGDVPSFTRLSGDDGSGPFVIEFVNNKPDICTKDGLTLYFTYLADGTIRVAKERRTPARNSMADCQAAINDKLKLLEEDFTRERDSLTAYMKILSELGFGAAGLGGGITNRCLFLAGLYAEAIIDLRAKFKEEHAALEKQYQECQEGSDPDPDPGDSGVTIDLSCPVPSGAEYDEIHYSNSTVEHYLLNGSDVGPWRWWKLDSGSNTYLNSECCKNAAGQLHGWAVEYYESGNMKSADHYTNGVQDGHAYDFYCNGTLWLDETWVNGVKTYSKVYDKDGNLQGYWDKAEGVFHVVGKGETGSLDCK